MNKTIIININGIVFHIEEDAYEILKNYMTDVKRHFINSADSLEITTDIENRIAEMFNDILARDAKQVIIEQDVRAVIEQMGTVEDFEIADEEGGPAFSNPYRNYEQAPRRLFRDPEDHLLGGVCAGIANYFDIQAVWIRLAFALLLFAGGTGLLVYIILWAVVPRAITRADRMAMKGERLDLKGFKRNFEEEMSGLKGHMSNFGTEARPFVYKARDFAGDFFYHLGGFLNGAGRVLAKVLGILILVMCFGLMIALIVTVISFLAFNNYGLYQLFPFNIVNHQVNTVFLICGFLALSIPLLAIALATFKGIFHVGGMSRSSGSTLLIIWLVAVGFVIYNAAKAFSEFKDGAKFTQKINLKPTANNVYYLKLNDARYFSNEDSIRYKLKDKFNGHVVIDDDDFNNGEWPENVHLDVERGDVNKPELIETFSARGSDFEDALANARVTTYRFTQQDSILIFDRHLQKPLNKLWRGQDLHLTLRLPLNTRVVVDEDIARHLGGMDIWGCKRDSKHENSPNATFVITDNGLQCKIDTALLKATADSTKKDTVQNQ